MKGSIVEEMYGATVNLEDLKDICILCPKNEHVNELNELIQDQIIKTETHEFYSIDSINGDDEEELNNFPLEYINSITPSGMPPHKLNLKEGSIVMLLRNLNPLKGLCNGTRLIIKKIRTNILEVEIISSGKFRGEIYFLPKITLSTKGTDLPFILNRFQYPVRLSFAMTINKSQGQTFTKVGIYLAEPVFCHGQLYVAFSRTSKFSNIKIKVFNYDKLQGNLKNDDRVYTRNVVYKEILNL